jgi:hypothetical protein
MTANHAPELWQRRTNIWRGLTRPPHRLTRQRKRRSPPYRRRGDLNQQGRGEADNDGKKQGRARPHRGAGRRQPVKPDRRLLNGAWSATGRETRECRRCKRRQPIENYRHPNKKNYPALRSTTCRDCEREQDRERYARYMADPATRAKIRRRDHREVHRELLNAYAREHMRALRRRRRQEGEP